MLKKIFAQKQKFKHEKNVSSKNYIYFKQKNIILQ